ncbi:MAG: hypothetical protein ACXAB2_07860, partial [Candidatus Hodarchaeales archaeon]
AFVPVKVIDIIVTHVNSLLAINGKLKVTPYRQPIYMKNSTYTSWLRDPIQLKKGDLIFHIPSLSWIEIRAIRELSGIFEVYDVATQPLNVFIANGFLLDIDKN